MASASNFSRVWAATAAAMLVAASLLLAYPAQAAAQSSLPDASVASAPPGTQDAFCLTSGTSSVANPGADGYRVAQTFTAMHSGQLTSAQMEVHQNNSGINSGDNYLLEIRTVDTSGVPTGTVLASTPIDNSTVPNGDSVITGNFASPAPVVAGVQYAISVGRPLSTHALFVDGGAPDPCPGKGYLAATSAGPFTEQTSFGGVDFVFAIYVTVTPPPGPTPHHKHKHHGGHHHKGGGHGGRGVA